ncbi:MAG: PocR ligand-binding domain-containing protein [Bacteroidota bacterium]|nr:PocR ligand-binding domain-containing protein [Bacteroidota bacterium]
MDQNKILGQRNEELKKIIDANLGQPQHQTEMPFSEIIDINQAETLIIKFYQYNKIPTALYDVQGKLIFSIGWKPTCTQFHCKADSTRRRCGESINYVNQQLVDKPYFYFQCINGFNGIAVPIHIRSKHTATIVLSQFFYHDENPDWGFFWNQAQENNFSVDKYLTTLHDIPRFKSIEIEQITQNAGYLAELVSYLGNHNLNQREQQKKHTDNEKLLSVLREKISEQDKVIQALMQDITSHQKEIQETTISKNELWHLQKQLNRKLEKAESLLNNLLKAMPLGVAFIKKAVLTFVNDPMTRLLGYTAKELSGRGVEVLLDPAGDNREIVELVANPSIMGHNRIFITNVIRKDGQTLEVVLFLSLFNSNSPQQGMSLSFIDISSIIHPLSDFLALNEKETVPVAISYPHPRQRRSPGFRGTQI